LIIEGAALKIEKNPAVLIYLSFYEILLKSMAMFVRSR